MLSTSIFAFFIFTFTSFVIADDQSNLSTNPQQWSFPNLKEPKGFNIFPISAGDPESCQVMLVFERDFNDMVHDYHLYAFYEKDEQQPYYVLPVHYEDETKLAITNTTARGQRGAYYLKDGYTLTPVVYTACKKDQNGKTIVPEKYFIKMTKFDSGSESQTLWQSNNFTLSTSSTIVPGTGVDKVSAKWIGSAPGNENIIEIDWHLLTLFNDQIKGFFVLIGPNENAFHIYNTFIEDPNQTKTQMKIGYFYKDYAASVVVLSKDGSLTNPKNVAQVKVQY